MKTDSFKAPEMNDLREDFESGQTVDSSSFLLSEFSDDFSIGLDMGPFVAAMDLDNFF